MFGPYRRRSPHPDRPAARLAEGSSAADLGGVAIKAALERAGVAADQVDYVIMGQVLQAGAGPDPRPPGRGQGAASRWTSPRSPSTRSACPASTRSRWPTS